MSAARACDSARGRPSLWSGIGSRPSFLPPCIVPRLVIHVGPHKTGSTSVQSACAAHREDLRRDGVLYPAFPGAAFATSHADAVLLLNAGRADAFLDWLLAAWRQAGDEGCDTLLLSSEEFSGSLVLRPLERTLRRFRQASGAETRTVFVHRPVAELALSSLLQSLTGETGTFFKHRYDIRRWAASFAARTRATEAFFARHGGVTIPLAGHPPQTLAARVLEAGTGRSFPDLVSPPENVSADKFAAAPLLIASYGLRVMSRVIHGHSIVAPACVAEALATIESLTMNEPAFRKLIADFTRTLRDQIALGIADAQRPATLLGRLASCVAPLRRRAA